MGAAPEAQVAVLLRHQLRAEPFQLLQPAHRHAVPGMMHFSHRFGPASMHFFQTLFVAGQQ